MNNDTSKIEKLRAYLNSSDLDGALISEPHSLRYFTGFTGGEGFALVSRGGCRLYTDSRYTTQAEHECKEATVHTVTRESPYILQISSACSSQDIVRIGFEDDSMTCRVYCAFAKEMQNVQFLPLGKAFVKMREIKTEKEIALITAAEEIGSAAYAHAAGLLTPGMTELEAAAEIEGFMKRSGAERLSFETIIASGARSAMPHGTASGKKIEKGDLVVMDFGCIYNGYCSDMTRTVAVGCASEKQKELYDTVLAAQQAAFELIRPGIVCRDVDRAARRVIEDAGYGEYFGHGLGHGVGLDIHEEPAFSARDDTVLAPGMVLSVEPGIYLPGAYGIRIEDLIVVTENGFRNLASVDKAFTVIK